MAYLNHWSLNIFCSLFHKTFFWKNLDIYQLTSKISPLPHGLLEWLLSIKQVIASFSEDMEKREPSWAICGNVHWCCHCGNQCAGSSKNKNITIIWSSYRTSGYLYKEYKNTNSKRYMHTCVHSNIIYNSQDMKTT